MSHHWADDQRSSRRDDPDRLRDDVVGALAELTTLRMTRRSIEELPPEVVDRLIHLLGPEEIANVLSINDLDLKIPEPIAIEGPDAPPSEDA